jgi:DNA-binding Lrp family transcriptional regulator
MERAGIIKGYSAMLEHRLLGYTITIVMEVTMSKGRLLEMEREIAKIPNVCAVYDTTGTTDAIIVAKFKSIDELSNFTKHVLSLPYVERTNTHVVLNTIKEDFRLL